MQMLAWNVKFWAQRMKVSCPTFHSISVCAHCSTKSECRQKVFGPPYDDCSSTDSHVYMKSRGFRVPCFWIYCEEKVLLELSITLCIQTSTLIVKMDFEESALASLWHKSW